MSAHAKQQGTAMAEAMRKAGIQPPSEAADDEAYLLAVEAWRAHPDDSHKRVAFITSRARPIWLYTMVVDTAPSGALYQFIATYLNRVGYKLHQERIEARRKAAGLEPVAKAPGPIGKRNPFEDRPGATSSPQDWPAILAPAPTSASPANPSAQPATTLPPTTTCAPAGPGPIAIEILKERHGYEKSLLDTTFVGTIQLKKCTVAMARDYITRTRADQRPMLIKLRFLENLCANLDGGVVLGHWYGPLVQEVADLHRKAEADYAEY